MCTNWKFRFFSGSCVLHLADADDGTANLFQLVGTHLRQHAGQVLQLVRILQTAPLVAAVRQELIVVLTLVVTGVEEILQIVESHAIDSELPFLCPGCTDGHEKRQYQ